MRDIQDPVAAAKLLVDHALSRFSTDNLSCMIIRLDKEALLEHQNNKDKAIGVEGDPATASGKVSEVEKILKNAQAKAAEDGGPSVGISASNSGKGHDPLAAEEASAEFVPTVIQGPVEEEPASIVDSPDATIQSEDKMDVDSSANTSKDTPVGAT